jgi:site-specific recombinase XerD
MEGNAMTSLAPVLQGFFTEHLTRSGVSPHTVASYRDTFRLLLCYARDQAGRPPSRLELADINAALVGGFLDHLETARGNSVPTRNARLAAIHSLFRYAALRCPEDALLIQRVLAVPLKRHHSAVVSFLTRAETDSLLAVPDQRTALGRRDHLLLLTAVQTGLRVSELTSLTCADAHLDAGPHLRCTGKGRKQRCTPLTRPTARLLRKWITDRHADPGDPLFPSRAGGHLSRDTVADLLARHLPAARRACPSLAGKHVTPHTLRHTAAMALRHAGIDLSTIALWLGHATTRSTDIYMHADLAIKEQALARTAPATAGKPGRYKPGDSLLTFLESL